VVIIGLDGTPHSLVTRLIGEGRLPNIAALTREGTLTAMNSVYPVGCRPWPGPHS